MSDILDSKIKQKKLVNLVRNSDLNTKFETLAAKAELKAEKNKIVQTANA